MKVIITLNMLIVIRKNFMNQGQKSEVKCYMCMQNICLRDESRNYIDRSHCDVLKCALQKLYPSGRSKSTDCERAINQQSCNQRAYVTICVPRVYRLDGLTRRTSRDFNKRNRRRLSERPGGQKSTSSHSSGEIARGPT